MKEYIVYLATNKLNKKMYIGISIRSLKERIRNHLNYTMKQKTKFGNALRKYGIDGFSWRVIDKASTIEELSELEKQYIEQFDTFSEMGYNLTSGGEGNYFLSEESIKKLRYKKSKEHKEKLAAALRGIKHTDERRKNESLAHLGHKLSEETKEKMSLAQKGKPKSPEHIQAVVEARRKYFRKVLCVELNKIYNTIAEASSEHSLPHANIIKVCKGQRHTAGDYHWQYVEAA